jgi:cellobiose epimerase
LRLEIRLKMKISTSLFAFLLLACNLFSQVTESGSKIDQSLEMKQLKAEVRSNLVENILPFWSNKMIDNTNGGFYGRIDVNDKLYPDAYKGGILNARILWTFSSAFRVLKDSAYLKIARRAKDYILAHFIDKQFGGAYMSLNSKGEALDTRKQIYTQAFFIYALAEYYRVTGDKEALEQAKELFELVEKYGYDDAFNGYFEVYSRDWKRKKDKLIGEKTRKDKKGMNTHLHILEAYTNLYRVFPDERVASRLRNLIELFEEKIVNQQTFHLNFFMDEKWKITTSIDSYGHDIEASWLLVEAAGLLKDPLLISKIKTLSGKIATAACEGLQPDGSLVYEKQNDNGKINAKREWWVQAESVVGFANAFELTGDESYSAKAKNTWKYIDKYIVDHKNGDWYYDVDANGKPSGDKAGPWKCPYHSSRMCMEIIERF